MTDFVAQTKSTIDRMAVEIASALGYEFAELDDEHAAERVLTESGNAIIWQFMEMREKPRAPLYEGAFAVGVKAQNNDPGNYGLFDALAAIKAKFPEGVGFTVGDYAHVPAVVDTGFMVVTHSNLEEQLVDSGSQLRLYAFSFKAAAK